MESTVTLSVFTPLDRLRLLSSSSRVHLGGFRPTSATHHSKQGTRRGPYLLVLAQLAAPTSLKLHAHFARFGEQETETYEAAEARARRVQRTLEAPALVLAGAALSGGLLWGDRSCREMPNGSTCASSSAPCACAQSQRRTAAVRAPAAPCAHPWCRART